MTNIIDLNQLKNQKQNPFHSVVLRNNITSVFSFKIDILDRNVLILLYDWKDFIEDVKSVFMEEDIDEEYAFMALNAQGEQDIDYIYICFADISIKNIIRSIIESIGSIYVHAGECIDIRELSYLASDIIDEFKESIMNPSVKKDS